MTWFYLWRIIFLLKSKIWTLLITQLTLLNDSITIFIRLSFLALPLCLLVDLWRAVFREREKTGQCHTWAGEAPKWLLISPHSRRSSRDFTCVKTCIECRADFSRECVRFACVEKTLATKMQIGMAVWGNRRSQKVISQKNYPPFALWDKIRARRNWAADTYGQSLSNSIFFFVFLHFPPIWIHFKPANNFFWSIFS